MSEDRKPVSRKTEAHALFILDLISPIPALIDGDQVDRVYVELPLTALDIWRDRLKVA